MNQTIVKWSIHMKKFMKILVPILLSALIVVSIGWYLFVYDRAFTRDTLLDQARFNDLHGNSRMSSWFYNLAYNFSGADENVAIELANRYKSDGNYTKAEATLSNAIHDEPTVELYMALSKTYVEQDKLLDAISLLANISDPNMKSQLEALRPAVPAADYEPGFYSQYISVALSTPSGTLYCTTDNDYPSVAEDLYTDPITLEAGETTIYAITVGDNGLVSPLEILGYTVGGVIEPAVFTNAAMEAAVREYLEFDPNATLYTNDLWGIREFSIPDTVTSYEDLVLMPYLTSLTIANHTLKNLDDLTCLTKLQKLDLSKSSFPAESLSTLASLPSLQELTVTDCNLSTIAGLSNVTTLLRLNLTDNTIRNLEPLSHLTSLQELYMKGNALTDLSHLSSLTELRKLDVSYNNLTTLEPLAACPKLEWLEAEHNSISSVSGLEGMSLLQYLSLEYNQLTDISGLAGCTGITELSIASNAITDISAVSAMRNIDILDFSGNQVEALPQWQDGCQLRIIDGSYNALTSIDNLNQLANISYIYMEYNALTNIDALENCYHLVQVNVFGNKEIEDVSKLTDHSIIVNWDPT